MASKTQVRYHHTYHVGDLVESKFFAMEEMIFDGTGMILSITKSGFALPSGEKCDHAEILVNDKIVKTMTHYLKPVKP